MLKRCRFVQHTLDIQHVFFTSFHYDRRLQQMRLESNAIFALPASLREQLVVNLHLNDENTDSTMLHKVTIPRRIRQKLVTVGGKIMFGIIMTCLLTWDKMGLNWFEKLSKAFWAT